MTTEHVGGGADPAKILRLLWRAGEDEVKPGPRPKFTLDDVIVAGIAVADREGLPGLTMRAVAEELGVGTMSLYRYVPGKSELVDLMVDKLNAPGNFSGWRQGEWRAAMEDLAEGTWRLATEHPWLLQINQSRPLLGPSAMEGVELILGAFEGLGLKDREKVTILAAVGQFVNGCAREAVLAQESAAQTGVSDEEFWKAQEPYMIRAISEGRFPTLGTLDDDAWSTPPVEIMRAGLRALLDGFELDMKKRGTA